MSTAQISIICGLISLLIVVLGITARALSKWSKHSEQYGAALTLQGVKSQAAAQQFEAAVRLQGEQAKVAAAELRLETQRATRMAEDAANAAREAADAAAKTAVEAAEAAHEATAKAETAGTKWNAALIDEWREVKVKVDDLLRKSREWLAIRRDVDEIKAKVVGYETRIHDLERDHDRNHPDLFDDHEAVATTPGRVTSAVIHERSGRFTLKEPDALPPVDETVDLTDDDGKEGEK